MGQLQPSGGSQVTVVQGGNTATVSAGGALKVDNSAVTQPVSGTFWQSTQPVSGTFWQSTQPVSLAALPALVAGSAIIGSTYNLPAGCSGTGSAFVIHNTVGVATGGTSVSSVTGCLVECYVNNITNSAVTFQLADKSGTPIIWVGGGNNFIVPANSNLGCGSNSGSIVAGVVMASGITATAGTGSALNLHILTRE